MGRDDRPGGGPEIGVRRLTRQGNQRRRARRVAIVQADLVSIAVFAIMIVATGHRMIVVHGGHCRVRWHRHRAGHRGGRHRRRCREREKCQKEDAKPPHEMVTVSDIGALTYTCRCHMDEIARLGERRQHGFQSRGLNYLHLTVWQIGVACRGGTARAGLQEASRDDVATRPCGWVDGSRRPNTWGETMTVRLLARMSAFAATNISRSRETGRSLAGGLRPPRHEPGNDQCGR